MPGRGKRRCPFSGGRSAPIRLGPSALAESIQPGAAQSSPDHTHAAASSQPHTALAVRGSSQAASSSQGPRPEAAGRRGDGPEARKYARGRADVALAIARDPAAREHARVAFEAQFYAKTSLGPRESRQKRWEEVAGATGADPYDFSPALIVETMAILWAADYRTTVDIAEQARAEFIARGGEWTGMLDRAFKCAKRGALRGLGPVRHTAAFPWERLKELSNTERPRCADGPMWPRRLDVIACAWLLREIEAGNAALGDVRVEPGGVVIFTLPASKSDPAALGVARTHRCACGKRNCDPAVLEHDMCPACQLIEQAEFVRASFGNDLSRPLFPDSAGGFVPKAAMVESIKQAAVELGLPLTGHSGAELWGGHAWRRGGAQGYARAGVELWRIQALARHSSSAILGYVEGAHVMAMTGIAAEAAIGRSLAAVRAELAMLKARVAEERGPLEQALSRGSPQDALIPLALEDVAQEALPDVLPTDAALAAGEPAPAKSFVASTRKGGKIHVVDPSGGRVALCGWKFRFTTEFEISSCPRGPALAGGERRKRCSKCARRDGGGAADESSSSGSEEVSTPHNLAVLPGPSHSVGVA